MKINENEMLEELYPSNNVEVLSLSYSKLSSFDQDGCKALVEKTFFGNDGTKMGSLIDDLLYSNEEHISSTYFIFNGSKPTATLGTLTTIILNNFTSVPTKKEVLEIVIKNDFWKRNLDKTLQFDLPEFWGYLDAMINQKKLGKTLITTEEWVLAHDIVDTLRTHPHSKYYFDNSTNMISQYKFEYKFKGFIFRGIIDMIIIDKENKTVRFVDLKTGKNPLMQFSESFVKWRYYLQEAIYMKAFEIVKREFKLKGYKLLPFQFLYISRSEKIPFIFTVTEKWHKAALNGFKTKVSGYKFKGLYELIELVRWHINNNEFTYPKEIVEANGNMDIDDSWIV